MNKLGNTSTAVMQNRKEPKDGLDYYPTPPWATRALIEHLGFQKFRGLWALEPAAGGGHMAEVLKEYFQHVESYDIHDYGYQYNAILDFLDEGNHLKTDWVITNPPFNLAEEFIQRARKIAQCGVAMLVRTAFIEGKGRYERLFSKNPPSRVIQFVERVSMQKGRLVQKGNSATAYCWVVWEFGSVGAGTKLEWFKPCRKELEKDEDYV